MRKTETDRKNGTVDAFTPSFHNLYVYYLTFLIYLWQPIINFHFNPIISICIFPDFLNFFSTGGARHLTDSFEQVPQILLNLDANDMVWKKI